MSTIATPYRFTVGEILEIDQELPGRIHIVLVRQAVGF